MKKLFVFLSILFPAILFFYGCQPQEERTYTEAEAQKIYDNAVKLWNGGDIGIVDSLYAENCIYHNADVADIKGLEEMKEFITGVYASYPDFAVTLDESMKFKDRTVITYKATGTNEGPLGEEMQPTNKRISFTGVSISKIEDGKITEEWNYYNSLVINKQLGFKLVPVEEK